MSKYIKDPINIINRTTGNTVFRVETKDQYIKAYNFILNNNDVKMAIKVFCDMSNQTKKELLADFNLVELINCFSTNYHANIIRKRVDNGV